MIKLEKGMKLKPKKNLRIFDEADGLTLYVGMYYNLMRVAVTISKVIENGRYIEIEEGSNGYIYSKQWFEPIITNEK